MSDEQKEERDFTCPICGDTEPLNIERRLTQDETGYKARVVICAKRGHRWFLVGDRSPNKYNRLQDKRHRGSVTALNVRTTRTGKP